MIIYKTTNLINGKIYIGRDKYDDPNYLGSGVYYKRAEKKYGKENFRKVTIDSDDDFKQLCLKEVFWTDFNDARNPDVGYNISKNSGGGDNLSYHPERKEIIEKISRNTKLAMADPEIRAKMQGPKSEEHKKNLCISQRAVDRSGENNPNYGGLSEEHCKNISKSRIEKGTAKGKNNPMYGRTGELSPHFGKKQSEEHKRKRSESMMGKNRKLTDEQILEIIKLRQDNPKLSYKEIAKIYGVTSSPICALVNRKIHGDI